MKNLYEKARKLKELADRGVGGEKETAQRKYEEFCKKHNLNIDPASDEIRKNFQTWANKTIPKSEIESGFITLVNNSGFNENTVEFLLKNKTKIVNTLYGFSVLGSLTKYNITGMIEKLISTELKKRK